MGESFSAKGELNLVSHNGVFFFVSRHGNDMAFGLYLASCDAYVQRVSGYDLGIDSEDWLHGNVTKFISAICRLAAVTGETEELRRLAAASRAHVAYLNEKCDAFGISKVGDWLHGIRIASGHPDARRVLLDVVHETIDDLIEFSRRQGGAYIAEQTLALERATRAVQHGAAGVIDDYVPRSVLELRTEATLPVIRPWFEQSLTVPGDIAEFGCYKGTLSIKYAFYVRALQQSKTVYAFDTFEGFKIADPGGGALGIGAYEDNDNAYDELQKWSRVLPLVPVKGDARETCKILKAPLSFVWLDLDMAVLMGPVFDYLRGLCTNQSVLGVDDYGRPETPTVKPWADELEHRGVWHKLREYSDSHIAFYQKRD